MSCSSDFPRPETGLHLHARLITPDAKAQQEISVAYFPALCAWLEKAFPRVDPHDRQTAAENAIVTYFVSPNRFDPTKLRDLGAYLRMSARGDLLNLLARERRSWSRHPLRVPWVDVENGERRGNILREDGAPLAALLRRDDADRRQAFLERGRDSLRPEDRAVFDLMLDGERDTAPYARALGLESLPFAEQQRRVKQAKDRVMKRLQRGGHRHERSA